VEKGNLELLEFVFEKFEIDINLQFNGGNTLIHKASSANNIEIVKFLIDKGARVEVLNDQNKIPSQCTDNEEIKGLLIQAYKKDMELNKAILDLDEDKVRDLLFQKNARPDGGVDERGYFISNIRKAIEIENQDKGLIFLNLMLPFTNTKSSELIQFASQNNKTKILERLFNNFSEENEGEKAKILFILVVNLNIDLVRNFLKEDERSPDKYNFEHKYDYYENNNILQTAISNFNYIIQQKKVPENEEIKKNQEMIELLLGHIIHINPNHPAITSENDSGLNVINMLSYLNKFGEDLINKINEKKYSELATEKFEKLKEGIIEKKSTLFLSSLACCCIFLKKDNQKDEQKLVGVTADLVFSSQLANDSKKQPSTFIESSQFENSALIENYSR